MDGFSQQQADEFLGPEPEKTPNMSAADAERFLGPAPIAGYQPPAGGAAERDHWLQSNPVGRVLNAFGQGAEDAWGTSDLGFTPEAENLLKKYGVFNDASKGQTSILRSVNEALFRPAAAALDAAMRLPTAAYSGAQAMVIQAGAEAGDEGAGRELAMLPDAFAGSPHMFHTATPTPADMAQAADLGVVGQSEAAFKGTAEPVPPPAVRVADPAAAPSEPGAAAAAPGDPLAAAATPIAPAPESGTAAPETAPAPFKQFVPESPFSADTSIGLFPPGTEAEPVPTDVHGYARVLAPETFQEYDPLLQHRDDLRQQIADSQAELQRNAESQAPGAAQIAELEARMADATPRLAKKYQARLDALIPARDAFLADDFTMGALTRDTPEIAALRQQLLETDYRLRDLAPDVTEAYRKAAEKLPAPEEPAAAQVGAEQAEVTPAEAEASPPTAAPDQTEPVGAPEPATEAAERPAEPEPVPVDIAADVRRKLIAAGRPAEEAEAAAKVTQALWETRAARFGGKLGTAEQMYAREAPEIRGERVKAPTVEYAQKGRELSQAAAERYSPDGYLLNADGGTELGRIPEGIPNVDAGPIRATRGGQSGEDSGSGTELSQVRQGKIRLTQDGRSVITLMRTANASTYIHEMGHDWLERLMRDARDPAAPEDIRADAATVRQYLKLADGAEITGKAHEKFARSFERYFMEGRAPSKALADVFAKFRAWLTSIYQTVSKLRAPITADIRDVFDRLLAKEPERQPVTVPETPSDLAEAPEAPRQENPVAVTSNLAGLHEADAAATEPVDAFPVAEQVRKEAEGATVAHAPETGEQFAEAGTGSAGPGGGEGGGAAPGGDTGEDGGGAGTNAREGGRLQEPRPVLQGGGGAAAEGDRPQEGPNAPFTRLDDNLIDKAGNIRLDNLNQPEQVNEVIRQAAEARNDFIEARRGVISDQQVFDLADALGMTPADLNRRQLGQAFNAEQVMAARKLLVQSAIATREAMAKAATGSDADVLAYAEARARHLMIQEQVSGITAEAGRALRAFRSLGAEGAQAQALGDFLKQTTGRTLFQLKREAQAGAMLDTPQQVSKFVQDTKKATFGDMAFEYWINGLISGPATHTTYAIGNALLALWKAVPETAVAAAIGALREGAGAEGPRVYAGEVQAGLYGILKGQRDGFMAAWKAAKTGLTTELPGETVNDTQGSMAAAQGNFHGAIPGILGQVIRLPSRAVATVHSYFRAIGYSEALAQLAYRQAMAERLVGADFDARLADLTTNPTAAMMEAARGEATVQTMMGGGGAFTQKFAELTNTPIFGFRLMKVVDPFVKIGANVIGQSLMERSPLGLLDPEIRANLMGRNGPIARDTQVARIAVGSALGATAIGLAAQGYLTGGGPTDPKEAAMWRMTGKQPYSVRVGDTWYSAHRLGPLAMLLGVGADMYEVGSQAGQKDIGSMANLVVSSVSKNILNESFMKGVADLIQAAEDPDRYGAKYVRDQLGTLLPFSTGLSQVSRAVDPYMREARTTLDSIKARVPFVSEELQPRIDIWGQPMPNKDDLGFDGATAIAESRVNNDPVNQTMLRLGIFPAAPERKIVGVQLTDQQYEQFSVLAGRMAKMRLDALVNTPGFAALPDGVQAKVITDTMSNARRAAAELTKMQNPELIQQGIAFKRAVMTQGKKAAMAQTE